MSSFLPGTFLQEQGDHPTHRDNSMHRVCYCQLGIQSIITSCTHHGDSGKYSLKKDMRIVGSMKSMLDETKYKILESDLSFLFNVVLNLLCIAKLSRSPSSIKLRLKKALFLLYPATTHPSMKVYI